MIKYSYIYKFIIGNGSIDIRYHNSFFLNTVNRVGQKLKIIGYKLFDKNLYLNSNVFLVFVAPIKYYKNRMFQLLFSVCLIYSLGYVVGRIIGPNRINYLFLSIILALTYILGKLRKVNHDTIKNWVYNSWFIKAISFLID